MSENMFEKGLQLANQAIAHEEPERIPIWINYGSTPHILNENPDAAFKDTFYNRERAKNSIIQFHQEFQPDVQMSNLYSGKAEEIAETKYIDWPGRPGSAVLDNSIYQVHEYAFMEQEEYPELLKDFTGYMYIEQLNNLSNAQAMDACEKLLKIGKLQAEAQKDLDDLRRTLAGMGFPPMQTGVGLVPYDTLSNYFRGTIGTFEDLIECPDLVEQAVDLFTDLQIANFQYFRYAQMPVKRVMFWMHKGMDGFMSPGQFETLYWKPFMKVVHALAEMDVTSIIYTEGKYDSRLEQMVDLSEKKCVVHFENVNLQNAKNIVGKNSCITANFPVYLLEYGTEEQVIEEAKRQIDIGAPGGGFIFETNASIENVKRENLLVLYDTVRTYGKK